MKSSGDPARNIPLTGRLPAPASQAHAKRAARWKHATRDFHLERLPLTFDVDAGKTAMLGVRWLLRAAGAALLLLGGWAWLVAGDETDRVEKVLATVLLP